MGARRYRISLQTFNSITRHLTRSLRSLVSYRVEHLKRNFISARAHILFSIYHINCGVLQGFPALRKAVTTHVKKYRIFFTCIDIRLWIYESRIFELRIKTWIWKRSSQLWTLLKQFIFIHLFYSFIHHFTDLIGTNTSRSWLVSSVGWALHRYHSGHRFKSRTGLNFFQAFFLLLLSSSVHSCEDRFHIHVLI